MGFGLLNAQTIESYFTAGKIPVPGVVDSLDSDLSLKEPGLIASNRNFDLKWEDDGQLVIYFKGEQDQLWTSGTAGKGSHLDFHANTGKLIIYDGGDNILWSTTGTGGTKFELLDDRGMVMYNSSGQQIWQSNSSMPDMNSGSQVKVDMVGNVTQDFYVPDISGTKYLEFLIEGADGGKKQVKESWGSTRFIVKGGSGATIRAVFEIGTGAKQIPPRSIVRFIIGSKGRTRTGQSTSGCAGGGGSAVLFRKYGEPEWYLLAVAGGGGGAYSTCCGSKSEGKSAETGTSGSGGRGGSYSPGGTNGNRGGSPNYSEGDASAGGGAFGGGGRNGGAGWSGGRSDGPDYVSVVTPTGGDGGSAGDPSSNGGWGFGGGGRQGIGGGGGGGFSGGGQGYSYHGGGGGGSYINSWAVNTLRIMNSATTNTENGYATFEVVNSPNNFIGSYNYSVDLVGEQKVATIRSILDQGQCFDNKGGQILNGNPIQLSTCVENHNSNNQKWYFDGDYIRLSSHRNKCLDVPSSNTSNGTNLQLYDCNGTAAQQWIYHELTKTIRSKINTNKCIYPAGGNTSFGTNIQIWDCNLNNPAMQWTLQEAAPNHEDIVFGTIQHAPELDQCMDLYYEMVSNGTHIKTVPCSDLNYEYNTSQIWYVEDKHIKLVDNPAYCLALRNTVAVAGDIVHLWDCKDQANEQWIFDVPFQFIRSRVNPNTCLNVVNGDVRLSNCDEGEGKYNMQWTLPNAPTAMPAEQDLSIHLMIDDNKCVDTKTIGDTYFGYNLQVYDCKSSRAGQKFTFDGLKIKMQGSSNLCIDAADDGNVRLLRCNESNAQEWIFDFVAGAFRSKANLNKCMDFDYTRTANGTNIKLDNCKDNDAQKFVIK